MSNKPKRKSGDRTWRVEHREFGEREWKLWGEYPASMEQKLVIDQAKSLARMTPYTQARVISPNKLIVAQFAPQDVQKPNPDLR